MKIPEDLQSYYKDAKNLHEPWYLVSRETAIKWIERIAALEQDVQIKYECILRLQERREEEQQKIATLTEQLEQEQLEHRAASEQLIMAHDEMCDLRAELAQAKAEIERLNKMRTHCENCGADYMATGIEAGCPCLVKAERDTLRAQLEKLQEK